MIFKSTANNLGVSFGLKTYGIKLMVTYSESHEEEISKSNDDQQGQSSTNQPGLIGQWLGHIVKSDGVISKMAASSLQDKFFSWARENDMQKEAAEISEKQFGLELKRFQGVTHKRSNGIKYSMDVTKLRDHLLSLKALS